MCLSGLGLALESWNVKSSNKDVALLATSVISPRYLKLPEVKKHRKALFSLLDVGATVETESISSFKHRHNVPGYKKLPIRIKLSLSYFRQFLNAPSEELVRTPKEAGNWKCLTDMSVLKTWPPNNASCVSYIQGAGVGFVFGLVNLLSLHSESFVGALRGTRPAKLAALRDIAMVLPELVEWLLAICGCCLSPVNRANNSRLSINISTLGLVVVVLAPTNSVRSFSHHWRGLKIPTIFSRSQWEDECHFGMGCPFQWSARGAGGFSIWGMNKIYAVHIMVTLYHASHCPNLTALL